MTATTADQPRLDLENGLAAITAAEDELRVVALRITHRMRTDAEREDLEHINTARCALRRAIARLSRNHPNHRGEQP